MWCGDGSGERDWDDCAIAAFLDGFAQTSCGAPRRAGGFSYDQVGLDPVIAFVCIAVGGLYVSAQSCNGGAGDFEARHLNGCKRRNRDLGDVDVVEADD